jgi:hypothetical protein
LRCTAPGNIPHSYFLAMHPLKILTGPATASKMHAVNTFFSMSTLPCITSTYVFKIDWSIFSFDIKNISIFHRLSASTINAAIKRVYTCPDATFREIENCFSCSRQTQKVANFVLNSLRHVCSLNLHPESAVLFLKCDKNRWY